jgi:hypothetical protein
MNQAVAGITGSPIVLADLLDPMTRTVCGRAAVNQPCFTTEQFVSANRQADLGNIRRNSFRGPGSFNVDASILKAITVRERIRLALGISAYNALNHPNFLDPNFVLPSSGFGRITGTAINPSGPYGFEGGPSGRALVIKGRFAY